MQYDYLIVGAGFAGAVFARLVAEKHNAKVCIIDKRPHIAGNAFDCYNKDGILIHQYGPHIFHTNHKKVWDFLSLYTDWYYFQHHVLTLVDGQLVPMPININTINQLYGTNYNVFTIHEFFNKVKVNKTNIKTSEDVIVSKVGVELYEKFFKNYTKKQWGVYPEELDKSVTSRIPVRENFDNRYFTDVYQGMPLHGYTKLFESILKHQNITVKLKTDFFKIKDSLPHKKLVYCGALDEFFNYKYGRLPYRSLDFQFKTYNQEKYQAAPVVNYPNDYDFTRITEYKYLTNQQHAKTTVSFEFSKSEGEPYYPIPTADNFKIVAKYQADVSKLKDTLFIGRLAEYKYYNMDNVILRSIEEFEKIKV